MIQEKLGRSPHVDETDRHQFWIKCHVGKGDDEVIVKVPLTREQVRSLVSHIERWAR